MFRILYSSSISFFFFLQTGHNALQKAASEGHFEVAKLLLERGAPVDHQDEVVRYSDKFWLFYCTY